ncbi:hypothetical protein SAMN05421819_3972 [Bryocella elongata]|uniref:DUF2268 domain-containing protein n=1 Tax=Bryocella elongata TaxID=863522 RepID=A0A1H6BT45_9BACT|nr:hypothetical protein SAMN05421819_3972 [Bryocella elongata]
MFALTVTVDTDSAKAVLNALEDPQVTHETCLKIAAMPGNQGIIGKTNEFKITANDQLFADALYDAAHGIPVTDLEKRIYDFDAVKQRSSEHRAMLHEIETNPERFQKQVERRIALFTPAGSDFHLKGFIVAGGDGGGYTFGSTDFYLNIGRVDEIISAKSIMTHELYHAVQGAFDKDRGVLAEVPPPTNMPPDEQACLKTAHLFMDLYAEGTATYVADVSLLDHVQSEGGLRQKTDLADGVQHFQWGASLLEMSVLSFQADHAMAFDDVYDVDFYGHGVLYSVAYVMSKAIVEQNGAQGLTAYLRRPPYDFVLGYTRLAAYGKDKDHPVLGPNTIAAAEKLAKGCRAGS